MFSVGYFDGSRFLVPPSPDIFNKRDFFFFFWNASIYTKNVHERGWGHYKWELIKTYGQRWVRTMARRPFVTFVCVHRRRFTVNGNEFSAMYLRVWRAQKKKKIVKNLKNETKRKRNKRPANT